MIKIERNPTPPASLAIEKSKNGNYNKKDVVDQLYNDFHEKCYLCEIDELQSSEVEHLTAHRGNLDLKFDWNNLFLSCRHCNLIKNTNEYSEGIIDCCQEDPERHLNHSIIDNKVSVQPFDSTNKSAVKTARLLTDCFEKSNTGIREHTCDVRVKALKLTMTSLYNTLNKYKNEADVNSLEILKGMLDRSYKFAGFTRGYVRSHIDDYPELLPYVAL